MGLAKKFEKKLEDALKRDFGDKGEEIYANYVNARKKLVEEVLDEIKSEVGELTDHGPKHITNVLENAEKLLGDEINTIKAIDLYCLAVAILFHDVGNLYGRKAHNLKLTKVYNFVRGNDSAFAQERKVITSIARAHCGLSSDGSTDTLVDLTTDHLHDEKVKAREMAAVLRLADELAEGPQRTSAFMRLLNKYGEESKVYHDYARVTALCIDREHERISVSYNIELTDYTEEEFKKLMSFIFDRIQKMDIERKYTKYYTNLLNPFKSLDVTFNFTKQQYPCMLGLPDIKLTDKQNPGDFGKSITEHYPVYNIEEIWNKIRDFQIEEDE